MVPKARHQAAQLRQLFGITEARLTEVLLFQRTHWAEDRVCSNFFDGPFMKVHFSSTEAGAVHWQQRGIERLRQALRHLQRLLALDRQPMALALIPIPTTPRVARLPHLRTRRD